MGLASRYRSQCGPVVVRQERPGEFAEAATPDLAEQAATYKYYVTKGLERSKLENATVA